MVRHFSILFFSLLVFSCKGQKEEFVRIIVQPEVEVGKTINININFAEGLKGAIGDFNVQGIIKGRIEMSAKIEIKSKLTRKNIEPQEDKYNKKDELSIGAKAESYISLTIPTKCNAEGALDVDGYFSGVKLEFWFRATLHADETSSEPNYNKKIIDSIPINKTLKF